MRIRPFRILCLARSAERLEALHRTLGRGTEFLPLAAATADEAVALCVAHVIAAALVDAEAIRHQEWTVVKSLKLVKPALPVILLDGRGKSRIGPLPEGITEVVAPTPEEVFNAIQRAIKS